ncbi:3-dehydroquinate synthase [Naumannella sp. ID2617S]|nr:3-dehydroquinate synthase [Naumannella sp. ID2617S]
MTVVEVAAERPYRVRIGPGAVDGVAELVAGCDRVAVLYAPALAERAATLADGLDAAVLLIELPDAEQAKTADVLVECWDRLAGAGFTRSDAVVGLGGGATTDLAGFVAASWLRGVRLVTVPTTVLGMVDAAVGGKTGINLAAGKNLVGAFHEPAGVLCDLSLLATLPPADLRAGLAEVIKCGFIADPTILDLVEQSSAEALDPASDRLAELITRGIRVKAEVVGGDLREATSVGARVGRELLNYGHTLGHAIERRERYRWRHGEAISVGMVYAAELAHGLGLIDEALVARHRTVLELVGLPTSYGRDAWPELRAAMSLDKKTRGAQLRFVLLNGLASAEICAGPSEQSLQQAYARTC